MTYRIHAAEEIQLLLPENQPAANRGLRGFALFVVGLLMVALPVWRLRTTGAGAQPTRNTQ